MKFSLTNIKGVVWFLAQPKKYKTYKNKIEAARANMDLNLERSLMLEAMTLFAQDVAKRFDLRITVIGKENIPTDCGVLFAANHQGYADIFTMMYSSGKQLSFIARDNLEKIPLFGKWMSFLKCLFIKRGDPRQGIQIIKEGVSMLKDGYSLVIFPAATRTKNNDIGEFKPGTLKIATMSKSPIVPVTIKGTYKFYEENGTISPADITITYHEPIATTSLTREDEKSIHKVVEDIVKGV